MPATALNFKLSRKNFDIKLTIGNRLIPEVGTVLQTVCKFQGKQPHPHRLYNIIGNGLK